MEEVDSLIISAVKNLGCEFKAKRLKEFSNENIFEAVARSILHIKTDCGIQSVHLPPNMGSRFRIGTEIANIIKELGFKEDIGYQTILYGSETEIRRLLIFLIEKLPKESELPSLSGPKSAFDQLYQTTGQVLRNQLDAPWVPWFCKRLDYKWTGKYWAPSTFPLDTVSFLSSPLDLSNSVPFPSQVLKQSDLAPSVIVHNALLQRNLKQKDSEVLFRHIESQKLKSVRREKPKLPPKPKALVENESVLTETETSRTNAEKFQEDELNKEILLIESLKAEVESLEFEISQGNDRVAKCENILSLIKEENETSSLRRQQMEEEIKSRKRFVDLLPAVSENVQKLKDHLANSEVRMDNLISTWEIHRSNLQQQLASLRSKRGEKTEFERLQEEISQMSGKMETFREELNEKQNFVQILKAEHDKTERNVSRSFYTKRILEIVANVRKQKEEIERVLVEVRSVQKDINMLTGKLDRTFFATDELMFNDAKKDDLIRRAYKIVVSLHESCGEIISNVENTGHFLRDVRDFEDKIELEAQNGVDTKLEQLVNNYCEIKQENETIWSQIRKLTGTTTEYD